MVKESEVNIADVLFTVEKQPIYIQVGSGQGHLFESDNTTSKKYKTIPKFSAIVDVERDHVFSIVTDSYRFVTNQEPIELGQKCFLEIFGKVAASEMKVFNITMPKTRSFCHVDFVNSNVSFEPWQDDKWVPFLRVTNSYNRTKLLSFDMGFCRWICKNGMIFGAKSIEFRYPHTTQGIVEAIEFRTNFRELKQIQTEFVEQLNNIKRYHVPKKYMLPLLLRVFNIQVQPTDLEKPKRQEQLRDLSRYVHNFTGKYFEDMGENGYAALNVLTEFASRPISYISPANMMNQLQKLSGDWITGFLTEIKSDNFNFEEYLGDYLTFAENLKKAA